MDILWTPWRYAYVTGALDSSGNGTPAELGYTGNLGCVFCNLAAAADHAVAGGMARDEADRIARIVARGKHCFLILNAYPYASGHILVLPHRHVASLGALGADAVTEMSDWGVRIEAAFQRVYKPHGINMGLNLGKAAGAGVEEHLHLHALPRWTGDTNFMTVIGETRVLPEMLEETWRKLRPELGTGE